ncbi:MAG: sigma 54-interacting transcriptional regulator [Bacillota bacterium]|nr:sigma 54-interacting transcriptional regulator [Bacillota bacterium]
MPDLNTIQPFVQSVAEAIAAVLKIEVEIVNNELMRVGGTERLASQIGIKHKRGYVNNHVLKTGKAFVVENPGEHWLCEKCDLFGQCFYLAGIFCPIIVEGKAIGLISLIGFNNEQKINLMDNKSQYIDFINKMSDLLGVKALEQKVNTELRLTSRHLHTIVNNIQEGIIAVNHEGKISYLNASAEKTLKIFSANYVGKPIEESFTNSPLVEVLKKEKKILAREVVYTSGKYSVNVVSTAFPIMFEDRLIGAVESFNLMEEVQKIAYSLSGLQHISSFDNILGKSQKMMQIKENAKMVAAGSSTVLITGESGTGKELFARAIHQNSQRHCRPFISINCSAIPDSLLESELFGYEEGAFTGAKYGGKPGKFELADGGTIFLDEIGDLPLYLQAKLLRVLQEKKIERLGGVKTKAIDVRIIAATNRELSDMINKGEFRADLFYRLCVIPLSLPPLRERKEDIQSLMEHFLDKYNRILNKNFLGFSNEARCTILNYDWPGNVRELENVIEYACNFEINSEITVNSFPEKFRSRAYYRNQSDKRSGDLAERLRLGIREIETSVLKEGLKEFGSTVTGKERLANHLGISRATLYRKLKENNIS